MLTQVVPLCTFHKDTLECKLGFQILSTSQSVTTAQLYMILLLNVHLALWSKWIWELSNDQKKEKWVSKNCEGYEMLPHFQANKLA